MNEAGYPAQADVEEWLSTAILIGDVWANLRQGVSATWFGQGMAMIVERL